MMDCRAWEERLTLYVLSELDRAEELRLEEHLRECRSCREEVAALRQDLHTIEESMRAELRAPAGVVQAVETFVRAHERPRPLAVGARRFRVLWPALAASVVLLIAVLALFPKRDSSTLVAAAGDFSTAPTREQPPSPSMLSTMSREMGFPVTPRPPRPGARLVGCWIASLKGGKAAAFAYEYRGQRVVVYEAPAASAFLDPDREVPMFGKTLFCREWRDKAAVAWRVGGRVFILISRLDEKSLIQLAEPLMRST